MSRQGGRLQIPLMSHDTGLFNQGPPTLATCPPNIFVIGAQKTAKAALPCPLGRQAHTERAGAETTTPLTPPWTSSLGRHAIGGACPCRSSPDVTPDFTAACADQGALPESADAERLRDLMSSTRPICIARPRIRRAPSNSQLALQVQAGVRSQNEAATAESAYIQSPDVSAGRRSFDRVGRFQDVCSDCGPRLPDHPDTLVQRFMRALDAALNRQSASGRADQERKRAPLPHQGDCSRGLAPMFRERQVEGSPGTKFHRSPQGRNQDDQGHRPRRSQLRAQGHAPRRERPSVARSRRRCAFVTTHKTDAANTLTPCGFGWLLLNRCVGLTGQTHGRPGPPAIANAHRMRQERARPTSGAPQMRCGLARRFIPPLSNFCCARGIQRG